MHLVDFPSLLLRKTTFTTSWLLSCTQAQKKWSKFFPIRVDPFSERKVNNFDRVVSRESAIIPLNLPSRVRHTDVYRHVTFGSVSSQVSEWRICVVS